MKNKQSSLVMGYWQYASLEDLHHRSQLWLSDISFWKDELQFMQKLINHHFAFFLDPRRIGETRDLVNHIQLMEKDLGTLEENITEHESHLKKVFQAPGPHQEEKFRQEHGSLENLWDTFLNDYRLHKQTLFKLADDVLKDEKMRRLIAKA